jgi:hypothetical protein
VTKKEQARSFVNTAGPPSERLAGLVLALHRRKRERFESDRELYQIYRRVVDERPELVRDYAWRITRLAAAILADGVKRGEYKIGEVEAAAELVRDAVTAYVHPAHVEAATKAGVTMERRYSG